MYICCYCCVSGFVNLWRRGRELTDLYDRTGIVNPFRPPPPPTQTVKASPLCCTPASLICNRDTPLTEDSCTTVTLLRYDIRTSFLIVTERIILWLVKLACLTWKTTSWSLLKGGWASGGVKDERKRVKQHATLGEQVVLDFGPSTHSSMTSAKHP